MYLVWCKYFLSGNSMHLHDRARTVIFECDLSAVMATITCQQKYV